MEFRIRHNATGEVRSLDDLGPFDEFYFSDGGGGCDCLRRIWFAEAGCEDACFDDVCGDTEFDMEIRGGDVVLYSEFED